MVGHCREVCSIVYALASSLHVACVSRILGMYGVTAGGMKDLGLMQRLAKESNVPLPLADIVMSHEKEAEQQGKGALDWGCIADVLREKAGLGER